MQLSPIIGIAAIAVNVLYTNWDKIAEVWRDEETTAEAKRQKELADSIEGAAKAYEHEAAAMKGIKGEVTDVRQQAAKAASDKVGTNYAVEELAQQMKATGLYAARPPGKVVTERGVIGDSTRPETPAEKAKRDQEDIRRQARQLLTNARTGDIDANSRLEVLMNNPPFGGRFSNAYRLHQLQNPTGDDAIDQEADRRARASAEFRAEEARKQAEKDAEKFQGRAKDLSDNAPAASRRLVLDARAGGSDVDQAKLVDRMTQHAVDSGTDPAEARKIAEEAAKKLVEAIDKKLADSAVKEGITRTRAAQVAGVELEIEGRRRQMEAMQIELDLARKDIKEARVMSAADFAHSLLAARPRSAEDVAKKQLEQAQRAVSELEQIKLRLRDGIPARLGRG